MSQGTHKETLFKAIRAGMNVLIEGPHGTGKTALVMEVARELGWTCKYYSASTLDPWIDLVGMPVPDKEGGRIIFCRDPRLLDAEIVFFDELNRAQFKVLNAVLEMIQFRSINGEPLPRLKAIIAVCNPCDGSYQVNDLDPAMSDRFHVQISMEAKLVPDYFTGRFGQFMGKALCDWWINDLEREQKLMISPRRLQYIGDMVKADIDPSLSLLKNDKITWSLLKRRLAQQPPVSMQDFLGNPQMYAEKVAADPDIALRFAALLPQIHPRDMATVRDIILSLPPEMLVMIHRSAPFVFERAMKSIEAKDGAGDAQAFWELIHEKTGIRKGGKHVENSSKAA